MKIFVQRTLIWLPLFLLFLVLGLVGVVFSIGGYWRYLVSGPQEVMAKVSPNGEFNAFVLNSPSIDGPNQSLNIETADKREFLKIGDLVEDVDFIKEIIWAPDSRAVVFWSKDYITLVSTETFSSTRVYLGKPWLRKEAGHKFVFTTQPVTEVEWVEFGEKAVKYKFRESEEEKTLPF